MGRRRFYLHIQHGSETAEPLGTDPQLVDLVIEFNPQLSSVVSGPRAISSWMSICSIRASLASTAAFSAVPPMPIPSMPGGHQPAPMVGTVLSTHSTTSSEG